MWFTYFVMAKNDVSEGGIVIFHKGRFEGEKSPFDGGFLKYIYVRRIAVLLDNRRPL